MAKLASGAHEKAGGPVFKVEGTPFHRSGDAWPWPWGKRELGFEGWPCGGKTRWLLVFRAGKPSKLLGHFAMRNKGRAKLSDIGGDMGKRRRHVSRKSHSSISVPVVDYGDRESISHMPALCGSAFQAFDDGSLVSDHTVSWSPWTQYVGVLGGVVWTRRTV